MRSLMILLMVSTAYAQPQEAPPLAVQVERAQKHLAELRGALDALGTTQNAAVADSLQRLQRQLWEMQRTVAGPSVHRPGPPPPPAPPPSRQPRPIADATLAQLEAAIDAEGFSDGKLRVLQDAARSNFFLIAQLKKLVGHYSFSKDQVRAVEIVAPHLLDRENAFQLYDAFSFSGDKKKVEQILSR
jgi:hypothetical protein